MGEAFIVRKGGGIDTSDATATEAKILAPETAYVNGVKITGTIISKGAETITPTTSAQEIAAEQYLSGKQTIEAIPSAYKDMTGTDAVAGHILDGMKAGNTTGVITGSMVDKSGTTQDAVAAIDSTYIAMPIPANGYYNTVAKLRESFADLAALIGLTAAKVVTGNTILGVAGSGESFLADYISLIERDTAVTSLPEGLITIGSSAFAYATSLTEMDLPNSLTTIGNGNLGQYPFYSCTGLTKVWIPASVTTIPAGTSARGVFNGCSSTLKIYCEAASRPAGWGEYWNYYDSTHALPNTYWGATHQQYLDG